MSKSKTLTDQAAAAVQAVVQLGLRIVRASVLKQELDGYAWGLHAKDRNGKTYKLQAEKTEMLAASYAAHGVRPFTLTAYQDTAGLIRVIEGRHRVAMLPDDANVTLNVIELDPIAALSIASRSNGEGLGFTPTAAREQVAAIVLQLCDTLASNPPRTGALADLPLPKPRAPKAFTADRDGNPFSPHSKIGNAWTGQDFTIEGLAKLAALSVATTQRALDVLSGLWYAQETPDAVAGMSTERATFYARSVASETRKRGEQPVTPQTIAARRKLREGCRKGFDIKNAEGQVVKEPGKVGDALIAGQVTIEKPAEKDATPRPKRTPAQRIVVALTEAVRIAREMAEDDDSAPATIEDERAIKHAVEAIWSHLQTVEDTAAKKDAAADIDDDESATG